MALVKVTDIAYGRLRAPDLDAMEEFLTRFGLRRSERTANALYMRGTDPNHHIHVTEKGDPKFVGLAYYVDSEDDLKRLANAPRASGIETIDEPGGGKRVRLREPNGYQIEVVCGIAPVPEIPVRRQKLNSGETPLSRAGELMRLPKGPAHVKRIGHGVMMTPRFRETVGWFRETLGFICSDDVYVQDKDNIIGSFNRCDRGDRYVDHHVPTATGSISPTARISCRPRKRWSRNGARRRRKSSSITPVRDAAVASRRSAPQVLQAIAVLPARAGARPGRRGPPSRIAPARPALRPDR